MNEERAHAACMARRYQKAEDEHEERHRYQEKQRGKGAMRATVCISMCVRVLSSRCKDDKIE